MDEGPLKTELVEPAGLPGRTDRNRCVVRLQRLAPSRVTASTAATALNDQEAWREDPR